MSQVIRLKALECLYVFFLQNTNYFDFFTEAAEGTQIIQKHKGGTHMNEQLTSKGHFFSGSSVFLAAWYS